MNLEEYFSAIEDSDPSSWSAIDRPVFAQDLQQVSGSGEKWIEIDEHYTLLSFRENLSISIAIGLKHRDQFFEDWAQGFADKNASSVWVDFRYNGVPVYRALRVIVDGGRAGLPCPAPGSKEIAERHYRIWSLIDELTGTSLLADYFKRAGMVVVKRPWPPMRD